MKRKRIYPLPVGALDVVAVDDPALSQYSVHF